MEALITKAVEARLDEIADLVYYGYLYEDGDLEEFNLFARLLDEKFVPFTKGKRKKIAKEYDKAKSKPLGSGERFAALVKGGMPPALAAKIGREKHGKKKMAELSAKGKKRASKRMKKAD